MLSLKKYARIKSNPLLTSKLPRNHEDQLKLYYDLLDLFENLDKLYSEFVDVPFRLAFYQLSSDEMYEIIKNDLYKHININHLTKEQILTINKLVYDKIKASVELYLESVC